MYYRLVYHEYIVLCLVHTYSIFFNEEILHAIVLRWIFLHMSLQQI